LDLLQRREVGGPREQRLIDGALQSAERARILVQRLLAFARRQPLQPTAIDVADLFHGVRELIYSTAGPRIRVEFKVDPDLHPARADANQLEMALLNLAVNARDAMPEGGRLTLETANTEMDETYVRGHATARPGRYVVLAVSDTGIGMDAQTQARMFEPFFTTKEPGKGTGLGLATVYGIVKQAGGFIWVYSEPGRGTSFKIYLPRVDEPADTPATPAGPAPRGTETVLIVEDAAAVRTVTRQVLERQGYTVLEAPNGDAALQIAAKHHGPIHLLLTDVVMPGASGRQLAEQLVRLRPEIAVLYVSGYTDDAVVRHGVLESGVAYLQKPFTADRLAHRVREVLGPPRAA
jgi:CheY-like chemotaxis protein